jgi:hypothetical protein
MGCDMRDFRDAKAMATSLRQALNDQSITLTHSQSLELMAKAFGLDNWNILAAKIEAEKPPAGQLAPAEGKQTLYCSFCGKSQHEVATLIAGPAVFVCDACVSLCDGILADKKLSADLAAGRARRPEAPELEVAAEVLHTFADGELETLHKSNADWLEHIEWSLDQIAAARSGRAGAPWRPDETARRRGWTRDPLAGKSPEEIAAQQAHLQTMQAGVGERVGLLRQILDQRRSARPDGV